MTANNRTRWTLLAAVTLAVAPSDAYVSLQSGPVPFRWTHSTISFVIHEDADPSITDGSDETALRLAFETWEQVPHSRVRFLEDDRPSARRRLDWQADDLHLVWWDRANHSGFFGGEAGLVAITPVDFDPRTGEILDADILFDAQNYTFSTDLAPGTFDIQNVCTHEIGHFLGLDHSAVVACTMNPFANPQDTRLRSLEADDLAAANTLYPERTLGTITGTVTRDGHPVSGAHVVAEDIHGAPAAASLTDARGRFAIGGLDQGRYTLYAEPLDGPVRAGNFSLHTSHLEIDPDFSTTFYGHPHGHSHPARPDTVFVPHATHVSLPSPLTVHPRTPTTPNITSASLRHVAPGQRADLVLFGEHLDQLDHVTLPGVDRPIRLADTPRFEPTAVTIPLDIDAHALPQLLDVRLLHTSSGAATVLTGGLEIRLPAPRLLQLTPQRATPGHTITLRGAHLRHGARILLGRAILNAELRSPLSASFTVPNLPNGVYDVTLEDLDGQFARLQAALTVEHSPFEHLLVVAPDPTDLPSSEPLLPAPPTPTGPTATVAPGYGPLPRTPAADTPHTGLWRALPALLLACVALVAAGGALERRLRHFP